MTKTAVVLVVGFTRLSPPTFQKTIHHQKINDVSVMMVKTSMIMVHRINQASRVETMSLKAGVPTFRLVLLLLLLRNVQNCSGPIQKPS